MNRLRVAGRHVLGAVLLAATFASTTALAAEGRPTSPRAKKQLAARFQARLAKSLLVLVPSEEIAAKAALTARDRRVPNVLQDQRVPRSSLVAALLASDGYGLAGGSEFAAADAAAGNEVGQRRGRRPVSPNGPPDGPPGPPDGVPPGPPDGVPPGRPDGVPRGPEPK